MPSNPRILPWLAAAVTLSGCAVQLGGDDSPTAAATAEPTDTATEPQATQPQATWPPVTETQAAPPTPTVPPTPTITPPTPTPEPTLPPPEIYVLDRDVALKYDAWGVPHIYGNTLPDVLFAQGYAAARDRMWQMDMFRRTAWGRTAEVVGERGYDRDLFTRTLGLGALAEQIATTLPDSDPEVWEWLVAYSAGVNAYLADAADGERGAALSPQFAAMGYEPEPWYPVDCLAIDKLQTYALSSDHTTEIELGLATELLLSDQIFIDLFMPRPLDTTAIVPGYFDDNPPQRIKTPSPDEIKGIIKAREARRAMLPDISRQQVVDLIKHLESLELPWEGSNNWVAHGDLNENGHPIIASDTHEGAEAPATYWEAHLKAADGSIDAIGYTFPGVPFIAFGHNTYAAWAPTTNFVDVTDVFLENYRPVTGTVESFGQQIPVTSRTEVFKIRNEGAAYGDAERIEREFQWVPHHGPLLPEELLLGIPRLYISAQWTGHQPRHSYRFLHQVNTMASFADLQEAQQSFVAGAVNMVYADIDGNIGYTARTDVPVRQRIDNQNPPYLILPGQGEYDWTSEVYPDSWLPWAYNPEAGFVVTANNDPAGGTFDNDPTNDEVYLAGAYDSGTRAYRITELLEAARDSGTKLSLQDHADIQTDDLSRVAERTLPYLLAAAQRRPDLVDTRLQGALDTLTSWDLNCDLDAPGPLIFHAWLPEAIEAMFHDDVGDEIFADFDGVFVHVLIRPFAYYLDATADIIASFDPPGDGTEFPSPSGRNYFDDLTTTDVETRDVILLNALTVALDQLEVAYGPSAGWRWGAAHKITFSDEVGAALPGATSASYEVDGGLFTVDVADFQFTRGGEMIAPYDVGNAPSNRYLVELDPAGIKAWDVLPGGQTEQPGSTHFMDQVGLYLGNAYRDQVYYDAEVNTDVESELLLPDGFPGAVGPIGKGR